MQNEEPKFSEEARRDLIEAYDKLKEIDKYLSDQSLFYKVKANISLLLIVAVTSLGITIFAFPDKVVSRDLTLLQSVVPYDTLTITIDSTFQLNGFNNSTKTDAPIDTGYLMYRIDQARKKTK